LDYGCIVYGSARPSYIKLLDTVHHQGLRLSLEAFRTSPVESLYVEANELSLENRRIKLGMQYAMQSNFNLRHKVSGIEIGKEDVKQKLEKKKDLMLNIDKMKEILIQKL
jgi:hypothetical protein